MTRTQSASAIKGRTYVHPAQLQLYKGVTHTHTHMKPTASGWGRPSHYSAYFITAVTNTHGGGRMEVAIFRACVSALFEGDFGLAGVVIGYTYKCIFLPLPHVISEALYHPNPFLPLPTLVPGHDYIFNMSKGWSEWAVEWRKIERQMINLKKTDGEGWETLWQKIPK